MHIFGTSVDFNLNNTQNFRFENGIAFPSLSASDSGFVFYHTALGRFYGWTGTVWVTLNTDIAKPLLLENASVTTSYMIDWSYDTFLLTMTGGTTFTETNLPTSGTNTKVITIYMTGNFTPIFPSGWTTNLSGTYDGTVLNQIVVEFIKTGVYWVSINRAD